MMRGRNGDSERFGLFRDYLCILLKSFNPDSDNYRKISNVERASTLKSSAGNISGTIVTAHSESVECDFAGKLLGVLGKSAWEEYDSESLWQFIA
jgi:hypothetical protein